MIMHEYCIIVNYAEILHNCKWYKWIYGQPFHKAYPRTSHYGHTAVSQGIHKGKALKESSSKALSCIFNSDYLLAIAACAAANLAIGTRNGEQDT